LETPRGAYDGPGQDEVERIAAKCRAPGDGGRTEADPLETIVERALP
jgi:hypothetical protein